MITLTQERPEEAAEIESLLDRAFGFARKQKLSYRFRQAVPPIDWLSVVARRQGEGAILGSIRYWPLQVQDAAIGGAARADLLLGPLAVEPSLRGCGIGRALVFHTLDRACWSYAGRIFLVGALDYYRKFGFAPAAPRGYHMPGEASERLLMRDFGGGRGSSGGVLRPALRQTPMAPNPYDPERTKRRSF